MIPWKGARDATGAHLHNVPIGTLDEAPQAGYNAPGDDEGAEPGRGAEEPQALVGGNLRCQTSYINCPPSLGSSQTRGCSSLTAALSMTHVLQGWLLW